MSSDDKVYAMERIEWDDHHGSRSGSSDYWTPAEIEEKVKTGWRITTVGFNIYEDDGTVALASTLYGVDGRTQCREWTAIKKALIISRDVLAKAST